MLYELTACQRGKLAPSEQVFWCGKTRPTARFGDWPVPLVFGAVIFPIIVLGVLKIFGPVFIDAKAPAGVKTFSGLFSAMFIAFALGFLLSPIWHWLMSRGSVWAITDRRVIRFVGPFVRTWQSEKMFEHVEWSNSKNGCRDFAFAEHWVRSKGGGHMETDCIMDVRAEDVPFVEAAFHRLEEIRRASETLRQSVSVAAAEKFFRVFADAGRTRIVYRRRRIVKGIVFLTFVLAFFAATAWFVFVKGNEAHWTAALFCLPLILACAPFVYDMFGRREITMANGLGAYFNGVGRIGIRRPFAYDAKTRIRIGETQYRVNGKGLPEAQLLAPGHSAPRRLFAHGDKAVVEVFVRHMRKALSGGY